MGHPVLVAGLITCVNAVPNLRSAEQGDSNIAAQPQGVAIHNHCAAIGIARLWVVDGSGGRVRGVACMKAAAKLKIAERSSAQGRVGIVDVDCGVGFWTDKDDPHAEAARAWVDADNGSRRHLPIAQERRGLCVEGCGAGEDCKK